MERHNVLVSIVLYHPDEKQLLDLLAVCSEYSLVKLLCFDNAEVSNSLKSYISNLSHGVYFQSPRNVGVGGAHYFACEMAVKESYDFILFLDQDSTLEAGFIERMLINFSQLQQNYARLAAIGPSWIDKRCPSKKPSKGLNVPTKMLISSGMLAKVNFLAEIGYPKKEYFLDHVDREWCLRAINKNYQLIKLNDVCMYHALAEVRKFGVFYLKYHKPNRYYYCIRNSFFMFNEKWIPLLPRIYILFKNCKQLLKIPFVPEPLASCIAVWRALKEGVWSILEKK